MLLTISECTTGNRKDLNHQNKQNLRIETTLILVIFRKDIRSVENKETHFSLKFYVKC